MKITQEADNAVRIVHCLAAAGGRLDAATIAQRTAVTPGFTLKILRKLVAAGLVNSYKGHGGGYELARAPAQINLNEVISATDGPYILCRCLDESHCCERCECMFREVYADISQVITDKLSEVTFDRFL